MTASRRPAACSRRGAQRLLCALAASASLAAACSGGGGSAKSFCESLSSGPDPVALFASASAAPDQMAAGIERLRALQSAAPSEVKGSLGDLVAVATDLQKVLSARSQSSAGATPATMPPADAEKASKAAQAVTQYAATKCSVDLAATTTSTPPSLVTPPRSG